MKDVTSSIFDSITVTGTPAAGNQPAAPSPQTARSAGGNVAVACDTGLVAGVMPEEFERVVSLASGAVVLRKQQNPEPKKKGARSYRYVASIEGIIFVTMSDRQLTFGPGVLEINCLGILHDGKPFGRDEVVL